MSTDQSRPEATGPIDETESMGVQPDADQTIQIAEARTTEFAATPPLSPPVSSPPAPESVPAPAPAPVPPVARPVAPGRPALRVGTVVWGLVLAVIGAGVIAVAAGVRFDVELASIALLALAGVGLLAGSIATSARRRNR